MQIVTISRPTAYGEYAPYQFVDTEQEFEIMTIYFIPSFLELFSYLPYYIFLSAPFPINQKWITVLAAQNSSIKLPVFCFPLGNNLYESLCANPLAMNHTFLIHNR